MYHYRLSCRAASRSTLRRATRTAIRARWRAPDDLRTALTCFSRALRAHHRLARLAPRFFDSVLIERERREQEDRRLWLDSWNEAFLKVYGTAPASFPPVVEPPPLPPPRIQLAVECTLASCRAWLNTGSDALRQFRVRHPYAWVNFSRLARLYEVSTALARLATGVDSAPPQNTASAARS
jgi:hypothetical protein